MPVVYMKTWHHDLLVINLMDYVKEQKLWERAKSILSFFVSNTFHFVKYAKIQIIPDLCFPLVLIWVNVGQKKTISRHILRSAFPIPHMGITCCQHCFREGSLKGMLYIC